MSYSISYADLFSRVYIAGTPEKDRDQADMIGRALSMLSGLPVIRVSSRNNIPIEHLNQRSLVIMEDKGNILGPCPASRGRVCCNYLTLNVYGGCTIGCTYCIMKSYLNYKPVTVAVNVREGLENLARLAERNPDKILRAGTGETGDSLLLDPLFDITRRFISGLSSYPNVFFEVKTKTSFVDHLLDIPTKGNAVLGFSLNPPSLTEVEEPGASPVEERLGAAEKAVTAGYFVSFHFDPIILSPGWEDEYIPLVNSLRRFPKDRISWISLGLFRYPPALKESMEPRPYLFGEFMASADGKYRYQQKSRIDVYRKMISALREFSGSPVYLCMEHEAVWKAVFGGLPRSIEGLGPIFGRVRDVHGV